MAKLAGKSAVVTGSASGIGRSTAVLFAREGARLVLADLNEAGNAQTRDLCEQLGAEAVTLHVDVSSERDIEGAVAMAGDRYGRLDVMFNNAGIAGAIGPLEFVDFEEWNRSLAVLVGGVFLGLKHAVAAMRLNGGGSIVSTASVWGLAGSEGMHAYCTAKAAVINLTRSAACELARENIRVNCICPGVISTPIVHGGTPHGIDMSEAWMTGLQPIERPGQPDDIANAALFLASGDAAWVTGHALVVDGGLTARSQFTGSPNIQGRLPSAFVGPSFLSQAANL